MVFLFCVDLCDLWACSPTCLFKRIERLGYSHRSPRFAQMRCVPYEKESVPISEKTHPCASVKLLPFGRWGPPGLVFFDKSKPHGHSTFLIPHSQKAVALIVLRQPGGKEVVVHLVGIVFLRDDVVLEEPLDGRLHRTG